MKIANAQEELVSFFTKFSKETFIPTLLIGHCGKDGSYAGPAFLKHEVDSHMEIYIDKESRERFFKFSKNRFGGTADPYVFRITSDGVFVGNEWWSKPSLVEDANSSTLRAAITAFKTAGSTTAKMPWDKFRDAAELLVHDLKRRDATRFATETKCKSPESIKISWEGSRAYCQFATGHLNFGRKFFEGFSLTAHKAIGYKSEKPYAQKYCKTREEAALWVVLHEWVHLFAGYEKHTKDMWIEIEKYAKEYNYLWD